MEEATDLTAVLPVYPQLVRLGIRYLGHQWPEG